MKICFRTDASLQIGTGHVMRCLTLADELRAAGAECQFICRKHPGNLIERIEQQGYSVGVLPTEDNTAEPQLNNHKAQSNYAAWLGVDFNRDAAQTQAEVGGAVVDWLIVDHYALDACWEKMMRPMCRRLMVIDDLANRPHDCDLLLDQNLGRIARDYDQLVHQACTVLTGPQYALLRPEFAALRGESLCRRAVPQFKRLLISMGGVDQFDVTGLVLDALQGFQLPVDLNITVVMGLHAPWLERVHALAAAMPRPTTVKVNVNNMAQLIAESDLAIGAAGISSWERCCLGLPTLTIVLAENQRDGAVAMERSGSVILLEGGQSISHSLRLALDRCIESDVLHQLSKRSSLVTDGQGAKRVKDGIIAIHG